MSTIFQKIEPVSKKARVVALLKECNQGTDRIAGGIGSPGERSRGEGGPGSIFRRSPRFPPQSLGTIRKPLPAADARTSGNSSLRSLPDKAVSESRRALADSHRLCGTPGQDHEGFPGRKRGRSQASRQRLSLTNERQPGNQAASQRLNAG